MSNKNGTVGKDKRLIESLEESINIEIACEPKAHNDLIHSEPLETPASSIVNRRVVPDNREPDLVIKTPTEAVESRMMSFPRKYSK